MVFHEEVMKIGHHYGGLDMADADVLRRMMSGRGSIKNTWRKSMTNSLPIVRLCNILKIFYRDMGADGIICRLLFQQNALCVFSFGKLSKPVHDGPKAHHVKEAHFFSGFRLGRRNIC